MRAAPILTLVFSSTLCVSTAAAETRSFTFGGYLQEVATGSLVVAAQKSSITLAQAQIALARVFPDATLTFGVQQYDPTHDAPTATTVLLAIPVVLGGKRDARIDLADKQAQAAEADFEDALRSVRFQAADAYVTGLHARLILERKKRTYKSLEDLVAANKERLKVGDIGESTLLQSRVEAQQAKADVLAAEGEVQVSDTAMLMLLGKKVPPLDAPLVLDGDLAVPLRTLDAKALSETAKSARPDLRAARLRVSAGSSAIDLAEKNRIIDLTLGVSWQHNFPLHSDPPVPASNYLGLTVTVPLPFARVYKGDLLVAHTTKSQAEASLGALEAKIDLEVRQAVVRYQSAAARVKVYQGGVLADADAVLERTFYNFRKGGGATLVEVLVAQRTVNDVYLTYYEALAGAAHALVSVQAATATAAALK